MKTPMPSLEELLEPLRSISGLQDIDTDAPLADLGIDSIDVLEWIFTVEEQVGLDLDDLMEEFSQLDSFGDVTIRQLYDSVVAYVQRMRSEPTAGLGTLGADT